jgi:hypothetical protein
MVGLVYECRGLVVSLLLGVTEGRRFGGVGFC